jgi:hypothetical protein
MADYYPLLARAVAALDPNVPEARADVFERARGALLAQLRSVEPPLPEADIARERLGLEDAIRRIEDEARGLPSIGAARTEKPAAVSVGLPTPQPPVLQPSISPLAPSPLLAQPQRPKIGTQKERNRRKRNPIWIIALLLTPIIIGMGYFAYTLNVLDRRTTPEIASGTPDGNTQPRAPSPAPDTNSADKGTDRLNGNPATPETTPAKPATRPTTPGLPVAQRALLVLENLENPQELVQRTGNVAWRLASDSPGAGAPLETIVKGTFEFPEAKLRGEMTFRKNTDAAFPASHTIELVFYPEPDGPIGAIREISQFEGRDQQTVRGAAIQAAQQPVMDNVFLLALNGPEPFRTNNIDLLKERTWFYLEVKTASGRRAALSLERGDFGRSVFADAFRAWGQ